MDIQKPKKALRGLFSRTEPEIQPEENKQTQIINLSLPQNEIVPKLDSNLKSKIEEKNISTHLNTMEVSSQASPKIDIQSQDAAIEVIKNENEMVVLDSDNTPSNPILEKKDLAYTVTKIQYNFERLRLERNKWDKNEYISFLNRIDNAQTEAFFLKGKLIGEIKDRFYEGNKVGWKSFCDENLNMNYTTANQYIRVAEEFDISSKQRTDFGFEHFKALLPVPSEQRNKILENLPTSVSVKSLRNIVSKTLGKESNSLHTSTPKVHIRHITENLEKIKLQLESLNLNDLEQSDKWSLLGAFKNLSEEMSKMSEMLSKPQDSRYHSKHLGATSALIEDDYAT